MTSTLTCIRIDENYECKLIVDGKRSGEWKVPKVEIESEHGKEISTEIETSIRAFIATTDEYFDCSEEDNKLVCKGSVSRKVISKQNHKASFWEKLFEEIEGPR